LPIVAQSGGLIGPRLDVRKTFDVSFNSKAT